MPIRAITFDFWGTLYRDSREVGMRRRDLRVVQIRSFFAARNIALTTDRVRTALDAVEKHATAHRQREDRTLTKTQIGQAVASKLAQSLDPDAVTTLGNVVSGAIVQHPPLLIDGAVEALEALQGRYRMAVICDTRLSVGDALRRVMGDDLVLEYFETQVFSDETGIAKPAAHPFVHTIGLMGVPAEAAVHVGDSETLDVAGAKGIGMKAVLIRNGAAASPTRADVVLDSLAGLPAALETLS